MAKNNSPKVFVNTICKNRCMCIVQCACQWLSYRNYYCLQDYVVSIYHRKSDYQVVKHMFAHQMLHVQSFKWFAKIASKIMHSTTQLCV